MARKRIRVKVSGYYKPSDRVRVRGYSYLRRDVGARGRTPKGKRWFGPIRETGWRKSLPARLRRRRLLAATDRRLTAHGRYVQAARMIQALANVTTDRETRIAAQRDADYLFKKARQTP